MNKSIYYLFLLPLIFGNVSCASTSKSTQGEEKQIESPAPQVEPGGAPKKRRGTNEKKVRSFDPCLINENLPVCKESDVKSGQAQSAN